MITPGYGNDDSAIDYFGNMQGNLDVIAAWLPDRDVLCMIIEFVDTQTLLEITLLEHMAWTAPIEAALALPWVFQYHFPWIAVDEYSLKHAHDVGPPYGPPFTFTGHFQGLLRLAAKNKLVSGSHIYDKWPNDGDYSNFSRQQQEFGMFIHVCRACGCTFRCVVIKTNRVMCAHRGVAGEYFDDFDDCDCPHRGVAGVYFDDCDCLKNPRVSSAATFCSNSCYWDFMGPGGTLEMNQRRLRDIFGMGMSPRRFGTDNMEEE